MNKHSVYDSNADYTTNAKSYYDALAKNKKLIEELALKIWGYDETLKAKLEEIEYTLTHYSDILDGKLKTFDQTVFDLTQKWLDENMEKIMSDAVKFVWFGLTDDGHFMAVIPESWNEIDFDTTNEGQLILRY